MLVHTTVMHFTIDQKTVIHEPLMQKFNSFELYKGVVERITAEICVALDGYRPNTIVNATFYLNSINAPLLYIFFCQLNKHFIPDVSYP
jgi:hypothetical protein